MMGETDLAIFDTDVDFVVCRLPFALDPEKHLNFFSPDAEGNFLSAAGEKFMLRAFDKSGLLPQSETSAREHRTYVDHALASIHSGQTEKIVVSRIRHVQAVLDRRKAFVTLMDKYPDAFVYYLRMKDEGEWMGASPEILLEGENNHYHTISLAGTLPFNQEGKYAWTPKLRQEQAVVTKEILRQLSTLNAREVKAGEVREYRAGPVVHLRQDIHFTSEKNSGEIIAELHPTPAVCGLPREHARDFIQNTELHDRRLYTGVIGFESSSRLCSFVNLRCMQLFSDHVELYVGGGINAQSQADEEWQETEHKSRVLMDIVLGSV